MRNKVAKRLRKQAEGLTVGKGQKVTRKTYQDLKKEYNRTKRK